MYEKLYEKEKEKYRQILPFEISIERKYGGIDSMYKTFAPKIKLIIKELAKENKYIIPRVHLLAKIGIDVKNIKNYYEICAYFNLIEEVIERMGYVQSEETQLIYIFFEK